MMPAAFIQSVFPAIHVCPMTCRRILRTVFCVWHGTLLAVILFSGCLYAQHIPDRPTTEATDTVKTTDSTHYILINNIKLKGNTIGIHDRKIRQQKTRTWIATGINIAGYGGVMTALASAWYKDYEKTRLHSFNDSREWLQMDKVGHFYGTWIESRTNHELWKWTGMERKKRIWISGLSSFAFQTTIEYLDGRSADWGWSWSDFSANILGSGAFVAQELAWDEQRILFKWSFHRKNYSEASLNQRSNELFGNSNAERWLKDYNGQAYWASFSLQRLLPKAKLPDWLSMSVGYGADGMFGGIENIDRDENGAILFDRRDIKRHRQWYLSPDIDWSKIKTNKKILRLLFMALNAFKCPAPALELSKGKLRGHVLYF